MPSNTVDKNKVRFNLKNTHYAVRTEAGYGTPVAIPGSVNMNLAPEGEATPFYADGLVYFNSISNQGYTGDYEAARFPDEMLKDIWGYTEDDNKVLIENSNAEPKSFALLFQIDGDKNNDFYVFYNVTAQRPAIASSTNEKSKTPKTQSISMSAVPLEDGRVLARTTAETTAEVKSSWFTTVYTGGNHAA